MIRTCITILTVLSIGGSTAVAAPAGCRWSIPAEIVQRPTRWLGTCRSGAADGLGILRAGSREPYDFFLGRMVHGRPRDGIMIGHGTEWLAAHGFDRSGAISPSPEVEASDFEALFTRGGAAADAVARQMEASGNKASARYYRALAERVRKAVPE